MPKLCNVCNGYTDKTVKYNTCVCTTSNQESIKHWNDLAAREIGRELQTHLITECSKLDEKLKRYKQALEDIYGVCDEHLSQSLYGSQDIKTIQRLAYTALKGRARVK